VSQASHDIVPYVLEAMDPVLAELWERVEDELADADLLAIQTALYKTLRAGFRQGAIAVRFAAELQGLRIDVAGELEDLDPWAERHGENPQCV
jgi:hypothetical protein